MWISNRVIHYTISAIILDEFLQTFLLDLLYEKMEWKKMEISREIHYRIHDTILGGITGDNPTRSIAWSVYCEIISNFIYKVIGKKPKHNFEWGVVKLYFFPEIIRGVSYDISVNVVCNEMITHKKIKYEYIWPVSYPWKWIKSASNHPDAPLPKPKQIKIHNSANVIIYSIQAKKPHSQQNPGTYSVHSNWQCK